MYVLTAFSRLGSSGHRILPRWHVDLSVVPHKRTTQHHVHALLMQHCAAARADHRRRQVRDRTSREWSGGVDSNQQGKEGADKVDESLGLVIVVNALQLLALRMALAVLHLGGRG